MLEMVSVTDLVWLLAACIELDDGDEACKSRCDEGSSVIGEVEARQRRADEMLPAIRAVMADSAQVAVSVAEDELVFS